MTFEDTAANTVFSGTSAIGGLGSPSFSFSTSTTGFANGAYPGPRTPQVLLGLNSPSRGGQSSEGPLLFPAARSQSNILQYLQSQQQLRMIGLLAQEQRSAFGMNRNVASILAQAGAPSARSLHSDTIHQALQQQRLLALIQQQGASSNGLLLHRNGQSQVANLHQQQSPSLVPIQNLNPLSPSASISRLPAAALPQLHTQVAPGHDRSHPAGQALLVQPEDELRLSPHQVLLRTQIEVFRASRDDASTHTRGRNKPISIGQVGIRCRHCAYLPVARRQKGSTYFPASLQGIYQAAQNMSTTHMQCGLCSEMPDHIKQEFARLLATKAASSGAGRPYWAESAKKLGLVDTENGIRFAQDLPQDPPQSNIARANNA